MGSWGETDAANCMFAFSQIHTAPGASGATWFTRVGPSRCRQNPDKGPRGSLAFRHVRTGDRLTRHRACSGLDLGPAASGPREERFCHSSPLGLCRELQWLGIAPSLFGKPQSYIVQRGPRASFSARSMISRKISHVAIDNNQGVVKRTETQTTKGCYLKSLSPNA